MRRFDPEYAALKQLLDSGELGRTLLLHNVHRNKTVPETFRSEMIVRDSLVHEVDVARWLFGDEIARITVHAPKPTSLVGEGVLDPQFAVFEMASGAMADVEVFVNFQVGYEVRCEAVAERGSATIGLGVDVLTRRRRTLGWCGAGRLPGPLRAGVRPRDPALGERRGEGRDRRPDGLGRVRRRRGLHGRRASRCRRAVRWRSRWYDGVRCSGETQPRPVHVPARRRCWSCRRLVAELGYEWLELSPRDDFLPFFNHPRVDDATVRGLQDASSPRRGSGSRRCCRCTSGRGRTRTSGRRRSATGSARSGSPPTSAWT